MTLQGEEDHQRQWADARRLGKLRVGAVTLLEPKVKVASQGVFYACAPVMDLRHRVAVFLKPASPR